MSNIVKRTSLLVRDAEKAADWYTHVFGMTRWLDTPFTLSGRGLPIGKKGDKTRLIIMQCEDPEIGKIGLLECVDPPMDMPPVENRLLPGNPIFVINSSDVRGVCERAKASGAHVHAEPYEWTFTAPDGEVKNFLECTLFDLDGHFFEVNQLL